jgi:hypothetical protein
MGVINIADFRGGYCADIPNELMNNNEMLRAENCQWRNALIKRNGISTYSASDWSGFTGLKGAIRAYLNSTWYTIVALDDDTSVNFYYGAGTTFAAIDNDFDWTTGYDVEMAELDGHVVCVNGVDKPAVIYYDSGIVIENLETYDERERNNINWFAGQWDDDADETFIDDTTDAQDSGTGDFQIVGTTNDDGCYISCDFTFNKIIFTGAEQAAGTPVAVYEYWDGDSWETLTVTTAPTWTAAAGDKILEFDLPLAADGSVDWQVYGETSGTDGVENKFIVRITFSTAPTGAISCDYLTISNTQYLTQILQNDRPHAICQHNNQIYFAAGNIINFSPPHSVTGWREGQSEYFDEGGEKIIAMVSHKDSLVVFKANTIYTFSTTNLLDPIRSRPLTSVGAIAGRSPKMISGVICFLSKNGLYMWDGNLAVNISKHIQSDLDSYTLTNACAVNYKNEYLIAFPTDGVTLVFDPDTFRADDMGDGRVSIYKFTSYIVSGFINCYSATDTGYLLAWVDQAIPYLARCDYGAYDNIGATSNIDMRAQTKTFSFDNFQTDKYFGLLKPDIKEVSAFSGQRHKLVLYGDNGDMVKNIWLTIPKGSNHYSTDIRVPSNIDGKNLSIEFRHNKNTSATLYGYAIKAEERGF